MESKQEEKILISFWTKAGIYLWGLDKGTGNIDWKNGRKTLDETRAQIYALYPQAKLSVV